MTSNNCCPENARVLQRKMHCLVPRSGMAFDVAELGERVTTSSYLRRRPPADNFSLLRRTQQPNSRVIPTDPPSAPHRGLLALRAACCLFPAGGGVRVGRRRRASVFPPAARRSTPARSPGDSERDRDEPGRDHDPQRRSRQAIGDRTEGHHDLARVPRRQPPARRRPDDRPRRSRPEQGI